MASDCYLSHQPGEKRWKLKGKSCNISQTSDAMGEVIRDSSGEKKKCFAEECQEDWRNDDSRTSSSSSVATSDGTQLAEKDEKVEWIHTSRYNYHSLLQKKKRSLNLNSHIIMIFFHPAATLQASSVRSLGSGNQGWILWAEVKSNPWFNKSNKVNYCKIKHIECTLIKINNFQGKKHYFCIWKKKCTSLWGRGSTKYSNQHRFPSNIYQIVVNATRFSGRASLEKCTTRAENFFLMLHVAYTTI